MKLSNITPISRKRAFFYLSHIRTFDPIQYEHMTPKQAALANTFLQGTDHAWFPLSELLHRHPRNVD